MAIGTKADLEQRLQLTRRRIDQLLEVFVFIETQDGRFDLDLNCRRYKAYVDHDVEYIASELTRLGQQVDDGLDAMRAEPNLARRKKLAEQLAVGPALGRLDSVFRLSNHMMGPHHGPMLSIATNQMSRQAFGEFFDLIGIRLADDEAGPAPKKRGRKSA